MWASSIREWSFRERKGRVCQRIRDCTCRETTGRVCQRIRDCDCQEIKNRVCRFFRTLGDRICLAVFQNYLALLDRTVRMEFQMFQVDEEGRKQIRTHIHPEQYTGIVGFWHEDSYAMNLVLKEWNEAAGASACLHREKDPGMQVVVTADKRGDYIESMLSRCGASALRLGDGMRMRGGMKALTDAANAPGRGLAVALDGPLGPRREPKKLAFFLAREGKKRMSGVHVRYRGCLRLWRRWDRYAIPLPFTKIVVEIDDFGYISQERIREFPALARMARGVLTNFPR